MPPPPRQRLYKTSAGPKTEESLDRVSKQIELILWVAFFASIVMLIPMVSAFWEKQYQEIIVYILIILALLFIVRSCARGKKQLLRIWEEL